MNAKSINFGDTVRIRTTDSTKETGLADLVGTVYGETTLSSTGVEIVGELEADYAINVYFEGKNANAWFEPKLLVFVDHGAGTEMSLDGINKKWVKSKEGEWVEYTNDARSSKDRPWWKFW